MHWTETVLDEEWRCGPYRIERFSCHFSNRYNCMRSFDNGRGYFAVAKPQKTVDAAKRACRRDALRR